MSARRSATSSGKWSSSCNSSSSAQCVVCADARGILFSSSGSKKKASSHQCYHQFRGHSRVACSRGGCHCKNRYRNYVSFTPLYFRRDASGKRTERINEMFVLCLTSFAFFMWTGLTTVPLFYCTHTKILTRAAERNSTKRSKKKKII